MSAAVVLAAVSVIIAQAGGTPYISGGDSPGGTDCSGLASWVANAATGRPIYGDRFSTANGWCPRRRQRRISTAVHPPYAPPRRGTVRRVLIEERRTPLTGELSLATRFGVVTHIRPERDPNVPACDLPEVMDPARPAFGYTGRLLHADQAPVILLDQRMRQQITEWQRVWHEPFPAFGMRQAIRGDALTIEATNGAWIWRLLPAYWPQMSGHHNGDRGWWVGVWQN